MFKKRYILLLLLSARLFAADPTLVQSPDKKIAMKVFVQDAGLYYSVSYQDKPVIEPSPIRMTVDAKSITESAVIGKAERYQMDERYPWNGVHSTARNHYNGARISITKGAIHYTLDVRIFNEGASFRLVVPGKPREQRVADEATVFTLPADTQA